MWVVGGDFWLVVVGVVDGVVVVLL